MVVDVKGIALYGGHSIKASKVIDFTLKFEYSDLSEAVKALQMLNNDIKVEVKLVDEKPMKLGIFRIKSLNVSGDGSSKLVITSTSDFVEVDNLSNVVTDERFKIRMRADIEEEDGEENKEE